MDRKKHTQLRQFRVARVAIAVSTVRGQGPSGTVSATRQFLGALNLKRVPARSQAQFARWLDGATKRLHEKLPGRAPGWGAARKFLNIFLRDALYDADLNSTFRLHRIERWLEVPLDGDVGKRLRREREGAELPRWRTIKGLTPEVSAQFQAVAARVAARHQCERVHLDLVYWTGMQASQRPRQTRARRVVR